MHQHKTFFLFVFFFLYVLTKKIAKPAKCPISTKLSIVASDLAFDENTMVLGVHPDTKKVAVVKMEVLGNNKFWCIGEYTNPENQTYAIFVVPQTNWKQLYRNKDHGLIIKQRLFGMPHKERLRFTILETETQDKYKIAGFNEATISYLTNGANGVEMDPNGKDEWFIFVVE